MILPPSSLDIDLNFLKEFERGLNPLAPEQGANACKVLGYGEISTVIAIDKPGMQQVCFKRMPMFNTQDEVYTYEALYTEFLDILENQIGVRPVASRTVCIGRFHGMLVMYIVQKRLSSEVVAQRLIPALSENALCALLKSALLQTHKVFRFNANQGGALALAIDGQISNWALRDPADIAALERGEVVELDYLDTSTPQVKKNGQEQLNTELFLRSAPPWLRPLLRAFVVKDVAERYYGERNVAIDMVANFYKEQRPEVVPAMIEVVNAYFLEYSPQKAAITVKEVQDYYQGDAKIWKIYLGARKLDRKIRQWLGRPYPYILPDQVHR